MLDVKPLARRRPRRALELAQRTGHVVLGEPQRHARAPQRRLEVVIAARRRVLEVLAVLLAHREEVADKAQREQLEQPRRRALPVVAGRPAEQLDRRLNFSDAVAGIAAEVVVRALRARDHAADVRIVRIGADLERAVEQLVGALGVRAGRVEHRFDQQCALDVLPVTGLQRHPQVAGLEVHAADRVDHREARRGRLEHLELEHLGIGDLAAVPLAKPEAADAQRARFHSSDASDPRGVFGDATPISVEQRLERGDAPARCGR